MRDKEKEKINSHKRYLAHREERLLYAKEYARTHREVINAIQRRWRASHKEYYQNHQKAYRIRKHVERIISERSNSMKHRYGITADNYEKILLKQDGRCAICDTDVCELDKRLFIDHDHKTGKVRGLLCSLCNVMLGSARDNGEILSNAKEYLGQNV